MCKVIEMGQVVCFVLNLQTSQHSTFYLRNAKSHRDTNIEVEITIPLEMCDDKG